MNIDAASAKKWREKEGYSQSELGELIGATKNAYSQWEQGRSKAMSRDKMERLRLLMEGKKIAGSSQSTDIDVWAVVVDRMEALCSTLRSDRLGDTSKGSAFCFELGFLTAIAEISGISGPVSAQK